MALSEEKIKELVREKYGKTAKESGGCCEDGCCGGAPVLTDIEAFGRTLDYSDDDLAISKSDANLGLG